MLKFLISDNKLLIAIVRPTYRGSMGCRMQIIYFNKKRDVPLLVVIGVLLLGFVVMLIDVKDTRKFCTASLVGSSVENVELLAKRDGLAVIKGDKPEITVLSKYAGPDAPLCFIGFKNGVATKVELIESDSITATANNINNKIH